MPVIHKRYYFRRSVFGGFNRSDVINYMSAQSRDELSRKEDCEREITSLNRSAAELNERIAALSADNLSLSARADAGDAAAAELADLLSGIGRLSDLPENELAALPEDGGRLSGLTARIRAIISERDRLSEEIIALNKSIYEKDAELEKMTAFKASVEQLLGGGK